MRLKRLATASVTDSSVRADRSLRRGRTLRTSVSSVTAAATVIAPYPTVYRWVTGSRSISPWYSRVRSSRQAVLRLIPQARASSRTVGGVVLVATDFSSRTARSTAWIRNAPPPSSVSSAATGSEGSGTLAADLDTYAG